jgi:hypothetical protein
MRTAAQDPADLVGNLVAGATACAAPDLGDLCDHAHGQNRWLKSDSAKESGPSYGMLT